MKKPIEETGSWGASEASPKTEVKKGIDKRLILFIGIVVIVIVVTLLVI